MKQKHIFTFRNILVFLLIITLCLCVTCSSYERTGSFFSTLSAADSFDAAYADSVATVYTDSVYADSVATDSIIADAVSSAPVMTASAPLRLNFAAEETLSNTASSYSYLSMSNRTGNSSNHGILLIQSVLMTLLFGFFRNKQISFCNTCHRNELPSLCIARYIENADGKK